MFYPARAMAETDAPAPRDSHELIDDQEPSGALDGDERSDVLDDEDYEPGGGGRWLVGIGAVLLVAGLFLTWYHVVRPNGFAEDTTGWQTFTKLRFILLVGGIATLASVALVQTRAVTIGRTILGLVLAALVVRRIVSPPDLATSTVTSQLGVYVSLLGALGIVFGSLLGAGAEEDEDLDRPDGDPVPVAGAPVGALAAGDRPADGPLVADADVVEEPSIVEPSAGSVDGERDVAPPTPDSRLP